MERKQLLLDAAHFRHATKAFDPDQKISEEDFSFLLEIARLSPSSIGLEPWKFIVVQNEAIRKELSTYSSGAVKQLETASHFVIILARNDARYDSEYARHMMTNVKGMPEETFEQHILPAYRTFQDTNINILNRDRTLFDWASKQTYIALGNMMSAAAGIGIDSCPIEGFHYEKVTSFLQQKGIVNEDDPYDVSVMVAFGYRANEPNVSKVRQSQQEIVDWVE
ncbi:NAD(P)H-dependent oxidoreductase [Geomicrobium sp. JCM 19038]|uniref:NAD(P)H-dependent oxidoreductase n=1 Tax=Geomicrobium sp. JCM 19038 TaxID=1460635 RepID=UPI00045F19E9|nr:NAD(P)H-dependent oxidoreductase [Geomicrobium sp. JCM 19038]GAK08937.1 oxygen-insensitive NAD(P)H nitroreductase [Geomicrobium sp. JCM 19038]